MTTTAPTRPGPDWLIRAIDISRPCRPWEDPTIPGTTYTADTREQAEANLPAIRDTVTAYIAATPGAELLQIRIVATEYHGLTVVSAVRYPPNGDIPDDEAALTRRLIADDPAANVVATLRRADTAVVIAGQPGSTATENEIRRVPPGDACDDLVTLRVV
ncbi:hypothetical protein ABTX81_30365 [Kitasatospora sp. NPDC097605]|uniref:hypothetical protein n=1 Tax=Kitasatospora sp. NPDC097605 TaxID=3157226 RepID=UPI00332F7BC3